MNIETIELYVGLVFLTVFVISQILVLPTLGNTQVNKRKLKQRVEDVIHGNGKQPISIVKEKYLNQLGFIEKHLESSSGMVALKGLLDQAGKQQMAYRFAFVVVALSLTSALIAWVYFHNLIPVLGTFVIMMILPIAWLKKQKTKRLDLFEEQLPQALQMISRAMLTGYSFPECMKIVATEMTPPISQEFAITYEEINYGRDNEVAFALMIDRVPSLSLLAMTTAIMIQRQSGGNLAEVLLKISAVLNNRFKLQRRIKTLSAEGLFSAWIMILLPIVLFAVMNFLNPDYFIPIYESPDRMMFVYVFLSLELVAAFWIRLIIDIDI